MPKRRFTLHNILELKLFASSLSSTIWPKKQPKQTVTMQYRQQKAKSSKIKRRKNKRPRHQLSPEQIPSSPPISKRTATTMGKTENAGPRRPDTQRPTPGEPSKPTSNEPSPEIKHEEPWKSKYLASRWGDLEPHFLEMAEKRAQE